MVSFLLKQVIDIVAKALPVSQHIAEQHLVAPAISVQGAEVYHKPKNLADLPASLRQVFEELLGQQVALPARQLVRFEWVNVSSHGVVFRNLSIHIPSLVYYTLVNEYKGRLLFKQWIGKTAGGEQDGALGLVFDHWGSINYFHWIVESLPRLLVLRQAQPDCVLLLPAGVPQFIRDTIALFGFDRTLELTDGQVIEAKTLWFVEHMGNFWLQDAKLLQQVQTQVKSRYGLCDAPPHRCIYVSRSRANYRKVTNEAEVVALVSEAGFEVCYFEEMTFEQQVRLLHETRVLLGQHGASLTNVLWMQPGAAVLELQNEAAPNLAFFKLAGQCAVDYYCLACTSAEKEASNNSDILADTEKLRAVLHQTTI